MRGENSVRSGRELRGGGPSEELGDLVEEGFGVDGFGDVSDAAGFAGGFAVFEGVQSGDGDDGDVAGVAMGLPVGKMEQGWDETARPNYCCVGL